MAEEIHWIPSQGFTRENDAWKAVREFRDKDTSGMLLKLRGLGYDVKTGVRKKNGKWYPAIIYSK